MIGYLFGLEFSRKMAERCHGFVTSLDFLEKMFPIPQTLRRNRVTPRNVALRAPFRKLRGALPCLSADDQGPSEREVTDHGGRVGLGKRDLIHTSSRAPRVVAMGWHPTLQSPSGVLGMDLALDHPHFHHVTGGASRVVDTRLYQIPFSLCLRPSLCRHIGIGQGDNRLPLVNQIDRIR